MTYEELIVFYFNNDCVIAPNPIITEVFDRKSDTFNDRIAVIVNTGDFIVGLFDENGKDHRVALKDLTEDIVKHYLNRVKLKEKYQNANKLIKEANSDFI
jgi:hypothetical protein